MRITTMGMATLLAKKLGNKPQLLVEVNWGTRPERAYAGLGGVRWYGYVDCTVGSTNVEGRIVDVSDISSVKKADNVGSVSTATVTLNDEDGNLKATLDRLPLERRDVSIWQSFVGSAELLLLFKGKVVGPIEWHEGGRQFKFSVETIIFDREIGFAPETTTSVPGILLNPDAIGQTWPLAFGNVVHVPAVRITRPPKANLNRPFVSPDTKFQVLDGSTFPQNTPIKVNIEGVIFSGQFNQGTSYPDADAPGGTVDGTNVFTVYDSNLAKYTNLTFGARHAPEDNESPGSIAWLSTYVPIVNNYVLTQVTGVFQYFRVVRQEGLKVWFAGLPGDSTGAPYLFGPGDQILEVAKHGRVGWVIQESSSVSGLQNADVISRVPWKFLANTEVTLWTGLPDTYVANIIPGTIVSVYAYRTLPNIGRTFTHVPSIYYAKQENHAVNVIDQLGNHVTFNTTALQLITPIENFEGQGWEDTIYVTMRSSIGPNSSDVIKWLLQNYSNLTVDATSFNAVQTLVAHYPVGFYYSDNRNVMRAVEEVAWQSRCALIVDQGVVFIKYVSKKPSNDVQAIDSNTKYKTLDLGFTNTNDIITKFKATWKKTYQGLTTDTKYIYEHVNQDKYGLTTRNYDFYIYNIESLVKKSADFWANRLGNSWRRVKLTAFAPDVPLQLFDCVQFLFSDATLLNQPILGLLGIVQSYRYLPKGVPMVELEVELYAIAGGTADNYNYWMSDAGDVTPPDPTAQFRETPQDFLLADDESRARQLLANKLVSPSEVVSNTPPAPGFDGVVNIFENGYAEPATATNVSTRWVDPSNPPSPGDKVTTYQSGDDHYTQAKNGSGGASVTWGRIVAQPSPGVYTLNKVNYPGGPDTIPTATITAYEVHGSTIITVGTFLPCSPTNSPPAPAGFSFWFPVGTGSCT